MENITILATTVRKFNNLYSLNDLHAAAGSDKNNQPSFFLRNAQTKKLIAEIASANMQSAPVVTATSGENKGTYVCKPLVYAYAMWVSAKFHLAVIDAFDSLQSSSSTAPKAPTTEPGLALPAPKTTVVTTLIQGQAPVTQTFYGDVAVVPDSAVVSMLDEMAGAMQWMADAYGRLDAARIALVEATAVPFDAAGSSSRRAEAAREFLRGWRAGE